jgi:diguanylate cyclase (GGDEF)-like protein
MAFPVGIRARSSHLATALAAAAVPATGWAIHCAVLGRRLAKARRDPLTGALTRPGWTTRARQILDRYGDAGLVCFADVDHFRDLNNTFGHATGDAVLAATAARMADWAGPRGAVGRLGGDEMVIATRIAPGRRRVRLQQLVDALAQPVTVDGTRIEVAVSVGAAAGDLIGTRELPTLLRCADLALMQRAKHTGTPALAHRGDLTVASVNGRRVGRPGTATWGRAA